MGREMEKVIDKGSGLAMQEIVEDLFEDLCHSLRENDEMLFSLSMDLISQRKVSIQKKTLLQMKVNGFSTVHMAVSHSSHVILFSLTSKILELKGDIDQKDVESGWTPLHLACYLRKPLFVHHLISAGANVYRTDKNGNVPFDYLLTTEQFRSAASYRRWFVQKEGGNLLVQGSNKSYQLGTGDNVVSVKMRPLYIEEARGITQVAAGRQHTLFLGECGSIWAVGIGEGGRLGLGEEKTHPELTRLSRPEKLPCFRFIAASGSRSAAISKKGILFLWGAGTLEPTKVHGFPKDFLCKNVAIGDDFALAVEESGSLWAWGSNREKQLALGETVEYQEAPRRVTHFEGREVMAVFVGAPSFCAAIVKVSGTQQGEIFTWGGGWSRPRKVTLHYSQGTFYQAIKPNPIRVTAAGQRMYAMTSGNHVFSWKAGESIAYPCATLNKREIVDIDGHGPQLLAVDIFGSVMRLTPARDSDGTPNLLGSYRGVTRVAAGREHGVMISAAARLEYSPYFPGDPSETEECVDNEESLQALCARRLTEEIAVENVLSLVELARMCDNRALLIQCMRFAVNNLDMIMAYYQNTPLAIHGRALYMLTVAMQTPELPFHYIPDLAAEDAAVTQALCGRQQIPNPIVLSGGDQPSEADKGKRCKQIRKKLNAIASLEKRQACADSLSAEEQRKIDQRLALEEEYAKLIEDGFSPGPSPTLSASSPPAGENEMRVQRLPSLTADSDWALCEETPTSPNQEERSGDNSQPSSLPVNASTARSFSQRQAFQSRKQQGDSLDCSRPAPALVVGERRKSLTSESNHDKLKSDKTSSRKWKRSVSETSDLASSELGNAQAAAYPAEGVASTSTVSSSRSSSSSEPAEGSFPSLGSSSGSSQFSPQRSSPAHSSTWGSQASQASTHVEQKPKQGKSRRNRTSIMQLGAFPNVKVAPTPPPPPLVSKSEERPAIAPRTNAWLVLSKNGSRSNQPLPSSESASLLEIQQEERRKNGSRRALRKPKARAQAIPVEGSAEESMMCEYVKQSAAKNSPPGKKWNMPDKPTSRPSLAEIQSAEQRRSALLRKQPCNTVPAERCWTPLPADEPTQTKSLRKIEIEERALKAIRSQMKGVGVVRRVESK